MQRIAGRRKSKAISQKDGNCDASLYRLSATRKWVQYFIDIHVNILLTYKIVIPILPPVRGNVLSKSGK